MASDLPIVLMLHGFAGLGLMNRPLGGMLRHAGYRAVEISYDSWGTPLDRICNRLLLRIAELEKADSAPLHIVAHSMGGLVARALINLRRPANLGHVVMLGTPHGGSEIADFLDEHKLLRPILGRAAPALVTRLVPPPSDGKVSVASTRLPEAADHIVLPLSHALLPYHPSAQRQIRHFLAHGRFRPIDS